MTDNQGASELSTMPVPTTAHEAAAAASMPLQPGIEAFSFGEAESVLDRRDFLNFLEATHNGRWYNPPVSMNGLARAFDVPGPHSSCIRLKANLLTSHFVPSRYLSRQEFRKLALDFLATGNCYGERVDSIGGKPIEVRHSLARYTRRGVDEGRYFFVANPRKEHEFKRGAIWHLLLEHPSQEIYGVPEFMGSLQSALLGEAATIFRRRYYLNGSHAGFVFYLNEPTINDKDADAIRTALRESKGVGNFRNLFIHAPGGKAEGVKIIPISEVAAKDEFAGIKNVSRDDVLAAHRTPPQLVGIVPINNAGFGNVIDATAAFFQLEIEPLQSRMVELNDWLGVEAIAFKPYQPIGAKGDAAGGGA